MLRRPWIRFAFWCIMLREVYVTATKRRRRCHNPCLISLTRHLIANFSLDIHGIFATFILDAFASRYLSLFAQIKLFPRWCPYRVRCRMVSGCRTAYRQIVAFYFQLAGRCLSLCVRASARMYEKIFHLNIEKIVAVTIVVRRHHRCACAADVCMNNVAVGIILNYANLLNTICHI